MQSRLPVALLVLAVALFGVWRSILTLQHASNPVYDLPAWWVVVILVATGVAVLGAGVLLLTGRPRVVFPVFLVGLVVALTFFVFPSLGVIILAGLIVLGLRRRGWTMGRTALPAASAATSVSLALTAFLVFGNQQPVVQCYPGGAGMNGPAPFSGENGRMVASSSTNPAGRTHGTLSYGAHSYTFVCQGPRLVSFVKR